MEQYLVLDQSLIAHLYQEHSSGIFAYLLKQVRTKEVAEDLLLEIFVAALEFDDLPNLSPKQQRAWLWGIARHKAADHYREKIRHPKVQLTPFEELLYEDEAKMPEPLILQQERYTQLRQQVYRLPDHQQELLSLRFGHGLRCTEIAMILGKKEGAVRMLLSRTLHTLRKFYQQGREKDE